MNHSACIEWDEKKHSDKFQNPYIPDPTTIETALAWHSRKEFYKSQTTKKGPPFGEPF